jgi:outer membrane lipoprotein LolB
MKFREVVFVGRALPAMLSALLAEKSKARRAMPALQLPIVVALLLSACVTQAVKPLPPTADQIAIQESQLVAREDAVRLHPVWSFTGRVALKNGKNGGSGRIEWKQNGDVSQISLSAPITRQSWVLTLDENGARIDGLEGGPRTGNDAAALLRETTGWEIPIAALADWARGLRASPADAAQMQTAANGHLLHLQQNGWAIDYHWPQTTPITPAMQQRIDDATGDAKLQLIVDAAVELPQRIDAVKDAAQIKLIVDAWKVEPLAPSN